MTNVVTKFVFGKILRESPENNHGRNDPYFETVPTNKFSATGQPKMKKRKKALPPGLSEADQKTLVKVKRRAYRLDMAFGSFCGIRVGWSAIVGLFPAVGDCLDTLLALMVVRTASEANLSKFVLFRMLFNIALDFLVGLVPVVGDIADMAYKANTRNALILENFLRDRGVENIRQQGLPPQPDPSLSLTGYEIEGTGVSVVDQEPVAQPPPSYNPKEKKGWFGALRGGERLPDVEAQRLPDSRAKGVEMGAQQTGVTEGRR
ncbi:hypothetical protein RUND412_008414 [Rhizina undulata]